MAAKGNVKAMILTRLIGTVIISVALLSPAAAQVNPFGRAGFSLTEADVAKLEEATRPFYEDETVPLSTARAWSNPESGNAGTATLVSRFKHKDLPCRRIQHDIKLAKVADPYHFVIDRCQVADGSWKFL
jgi:surface antigen